MTDSIAAVSDHDRAVDLLSCEEEPIHTPGTIQPHGALLAARRDDFMITHASANLADFLGLSPDAALGRNLAELIGEDACHTVRAMLVSERQAVQVGWPIDAPMATDRVHMVPHTTNGLVYIELETALHASSERLAIQRTQSIMRALHAASNQDELCKIVTAKLRELTGYDRVMVYRFDRVGNGEVVAESCADDLEPYLGLRYPASDIPAQARQLYLAQRVRSIADATYVPVSVLTHASARSQPPLDMTFCSLRSVSPIHLEYMRNMGTRASLGISLIPAATLWGLLVCHHRSALVVTPALRVQCDLIGQLMSLLLSNMSEMEAYAEQFQRQRRLHEVVARMTESDRIVDTLLNNADELLAMVDASGAIIKIGDRTATLGLAPTIEAAQRAMTALHAAANGNVIAVDELQECVPDWDSESKAASGALYMSLPPDPNDAIIWFRPEMERLIKWGGNPVKPIDSAPTTERLSPRKSFAIWTEQVKGHSEPWQEADIATAQEIRRVIATASARQSVAELAKLRHYDPLTHLPNRRMLQEHLDSLAPMSDAALLYLDLDRFKIVNDTLGHPAGDKLLREAAKRIQSATRSNDLVARLGGDEFAVVATVTRDKSALAGMATRLVATLSAPYEIDGQMVFVGASVGIAVAPDDGSDPGTLMKSADLALYRAKNDGRGRYAFFEPSMELHVQARHRIERELHQALLHGEFALHYQPLIQVSDRQITGFEALLRRNHPIHGIISPAEFIPIAEESGLIVQMGEWVLENACREAAQWRNDLKLAVNISSVQFSSRTLVSVVIGALESSGLPAHRLELEITESTMMHNADATLATLKELKAFGVRISMDDFGTGYSSLAHLKKFPFDRIKVDRTFIHGIAQPTNLAIVRAVTDIAASMGIGTTAEGVETEEEFAVVKSARCDEVQGYLFSPPRPASDIPEMLARASGRHGSPHDRQSCGVDGDAARNDITCTSPRS